MTQQVIRLLLADDEASVREPLAKYLRQTHGYHVDTASSGAEVMAFLEQTRGHYDVALIDDLLIPAPDQEPEPLGVLLTKAITGSYPSITVIIFTGWGMQSGLEALRAGAYRYLAKPFNLEELGMLIQMAAEHSRLRGIAREKQILEQLMVTGAALLNERSLAEMLDIILHGIQAIGFDRVGLYLLSDDRQMMIGQAQVDMGPKFVGHERPVATDPHMQVLLANPQPRVFERNGSQSLPYEQELARDGVEQWACVPLILRGEVVGKLTMDNKFSRLPIIEAELAPVALFASQAAAAIENARLYEEASRERDYSEGLASQLLALHEITKMIQAELNLPHLLDLISQLAAKLLKADAGGILLWDDSQEHLVFKGAYGLGQHIVEGTRDLIGGSIAGRVVETGRAIIANDIPNDPRFYNPAADGEGLLAIVSTPLWVRGKIIGTLDIHSKSNRQAFNGDDLQTLSLVAAQAAIALENADLVTKNADKLRRLEQLAQVNNEIMSNLATMPLDERLDLITKYTAEILEAETCGIFLVETPGFLRLRASYGRQKDFFEKGREFIIQSGPRAGLTGHIAYEGKLFNAYGPELTHHFAGKGERYHGVSGHHYSMLAIPLKQKSGLDEKLIGLLRVDNKKDKNGQVGPTIGFTQEDEWILSLFAGAIVVAIEGAALVAKLSEQKDHWARLVDSSPNGVIAIDRQGQVTGFNAQAEMILKYSAPEILGKPVDLLYDDPQEPRRVGQLLHISPDGRLADYETLVRSKTGERIPIYLAATWLYDAQGNQIGSVGYFEDLRLIKEAEKRLELLLKASNTVAQAKNLTNGLQSLAEMMVTHLDLSFCRSFLLDETGQFLHAKAVYPAPIPTDRLDWDPMKEEDIIVVDQWPDIAEVLATGLPRLFRMNYKDHQSFLSERSRRLGLKRDIQSLLLMPLKTSGTVVGLLGLAELRPWKEAAFSKQKQELAAAIADQTAVLIERAYLYEETDRHRQLLITLDEASRHIRAEKETVKLLQEVVRLAAELANCAVGSLYLNHAQIRELELYSISGLPETLIGTRLPYDKGLAGMVARTGRSQIIHHYSDWPGCEDVFKSYQFKTVIGIPLGRVGEVEAVLFIADPSRILQFTEADIEILERFAAQASIALQTSRLLSLEQRMFGQLALLQKISDYIQAARDLDKILHILLTGVTAGYSLGFNRAALFLLDDRQEDVLIGRMGIGHLDREDARRDWEQDRMKGLLNFKHYLDALEQNSLAPTPIHERIQNLCLPLRVEKPDPLSRVVLERRYTLLILPEDIAKLPAAFVEAFEPALPLVIVPLIARDQSLGLLMADIKFSRMPITAEDVELLLTFTNTAAIAIDNIKLFHETEVARERLRSFYTASNAVVSSQNPKQVLRDIVDRARLEAEATWVSVALIDEAGRAQDLITTGIELPFGITEIIRSNGISMQVMRSGQVEVIEDVNKHGDRFNPHIRKNVAAALCLPLSLRGKRIGVMWIHYDHPRRFTKPEIEALQLYVNQAAVAYDSARRIKELEYRRQTAEALAGVAGLQEVLEQIVQSAREILQADSAVLWSYDPTRDSFIYEQSVAAGILPQAWKEFQKLRLRSGGTAYAVMEQGWIGVANVTDIEQYSFLGGSTRKLLGQIGAQSFQGVVLAVGQERLGVLYVNYNHLRSFSEEEQEAIRTFANQAGLALKKARLLEQVSKARNTAKIVAEGTALENLDNTLCAIAKGMVEVVNCDAVTLYVYDQDKDRFSNPSTIIGVHRPELALGYSEIPKNSLVFKMLAHEQPYIVDDIAADPLFRESRFAVDEKIVSCLAMALKVRAERVGVIFVNYRTPHHFSDDELTNIELFANQAAVAIRNAQLYEQVQNHARLLDAAARVARDATAILDIDKLLQETARLIANVFGFYHAGVFLLDDEGEYAVLQATYPKYDQGMLKRGHKLKVGREGIVGHVTQVGKPHLAPNVKEDVYHLVNPLLPETRSEMVFPLIAWGKIIGALDVQSKEVVNLKDEDVATLQTMADQLANAIHNAQQYEELKHAKGLIGARTALAWMGMADSVWRHATDKHALTIREQTQLLRRNLGHLSPQDQQAKIMDRLAMIERLATKILEKPLALPLSAEEGLELVAVNELISERARQLWQNDHYCVAELDFNLQLSNTAMVSASPEWLRRAFDILIDNAVNAVTHSALKKVTIGSRLANKGAEILVTDTGSGLPDDIREKIGLEFIEKSEDAKGMGMGLLMAQTIVQTYSGEIRVDTTGSTGTTMTIWLPLKA